MRPPAGDIGSPRVGRIRKKAYMISAVKLQACCFFFSLFLSKRKKAMFSPRQSLEKSYKNMSYIIDKQERVCYTMNVKYK